MSNEQNIDDILKLLKSSVSEDGSAVNDAEDDKSSDDMSEEILKSRLKMQYMDTEGEEPVESTEEIPDGYNDYSLDDEFLQDVLSNDDDSEEPDAVPEPDTSAVDEFFKEDYVMSDKPEPFAVEYNESELFDVPDEIKVEPVIDMQQEIIEDDDDITFDDIEAIDDIDDVSLEKIDLPWDDNDDDITFEDIDFVADPEENIIFDDIDLMSDITKKSEEENNTADVPRDIDEFDAESELEYIEILDGDEELEAPLSPEDFEDLETFEESSTFAFFGDDNAAAKPDSEKTYEELEEDLCEKDVLTDSAEFIHADTGEELDEIIIDSANTGKALDFDVYAPLGAHATANGPDIYSLFAEEKEKRVQEDPVVSELGEEPIAEEEQGIDISEESFLFEENEPVTPIDTDEILIPLNETDEVEAEEPVEIFDSVDETAEDSVPITEEEKEIDFSEMNIMMQLGFEEELKDAVSDEKLKDFLRYDDADKEQSDFAKAKKRGVDASDDAEYISAEQNDYISAKYRTDSIKSLLKVIFTGLIAVIIWLFELAPRMNIHFDGLLDYNVYPSIYMLFGTQLLLLAAVVVYRSMINGVISAFALVPDGHSAVSLTVMLSIVYDAVMMIIVALGKGDYPPVFNALAASLIAISAFADYLMLLAEKNAFSVYSLEEKKYTLVKETDSDRVKEKLIKGGISKDKNVYATEVVDFPKGFKKLVGADTGSYRTVRIFAIPVFILSIIACVVSVSLGRELPEIAGSVMVPFCMSMPVMIIISETLPCFVASVKLKKRGSAVVGRNMYRKYAEADMFVFNDTQVFEKCRSENLGVAIYDTSVGYLALGCFKAVYDKIGGPLADLDINLPDAFKFTDVKIRHISRNGIDSVIDGRYNFLVGDYNFMQRYGLSFPKSDIDRSSEKAGILCLSLDQKITAKISVKYEMSQIFEMLSERLAEDGISSIITTYDPIISSSFVAKNRKLGSSPISVVHKNSNDFYAGDLGARNRYAPDGIVSCMSSLKLAETLVWCKRVEKSRKISETAISVFSIGGLLLSILFIFVGMTQYVSQTLIMLYLLIEMGAISTIMLANIPDKHYFTVKAVQEDMLDDDSSEDRTGDYGIFSKVKNIFKRNNTSGDIEDDVADEEPKEKKKAFSFGLKNRKKDQDEE